MNLADLEDLTAEYGEGWGLPHARRVLHLAEIIGEGLPYNSQAVRIAALLHDWGAFPRYRQPGVDHAQRSHQVAESEILPLMDLPEATQQIILEAIEHHDYRDPHPLVSNEARLLREADMLEMLGVVGLVREFAWGPNNLAVCRQRVANRMQGIQGQFSLPKAQALAANRLKRMTQALQWLDEESFGEY